MQAKKKILTGVRPTGPLHLGHYVGALEQWRELQHNYDCNFLIADYQALSDHFDNIDLIRKSVLDVALDWLSVGLDPNKCAFVIQSHIPEHAELMVLLSFISPLGMLERNPTLKSELASLQPSQRSVGFFNYPISQVADILLPRANLVPVGEDQTPHIEMTREIARRFNNMFGTVFDEPAQLIGRVGRLVGTDGNHKMSKSRGNVILLSDNEDTVNRKVRSMYTDPNRVHATDPGTVEGNPVFEYHTAFNDDLEEVANLKELYKVGRVGDIAVKVALAKAINRFLDPIRERRLYYKQHIDDVHSALMQGTLKAKKQAEETMRCVRDAMHISSYTTSINHQIH